MEEPLDEWNDKLVEHILEHGDDLSFTKRFWKECDQSPADVAQFQRFAFSLEKAYNVESSAAIAQDLGVTSSPVDSWILLDKMPKLAHHLKRYLLLGEPGSALLWLSVDIGTHGIPMGPFLRVPRVVDSWNEVWKVVSQLQPLDVGRSEANREFHFGFLLGMIVGDTAKSKPAVGHRHLDLTLSQKYETNLKLGEFTCSSARSLGLRMHRIKDIPQPKWKPHGFFAWVSQASPLIDWIYNVGLGLSDKEVTTYDSLRAAWVFDSPREFRVGLVQGLAESDGSPNVASQSVEFWIGPNWEWMIRLLATFGLRAFRSRQAVVLSKSQAIKAFEVPVFSDQIRTVRFRRHEMLATTRRLARTDRLPETLRKEIMHLALQRLSASKIVEEIARRQRVLVSFEAAQRWAQKARNCEVM